MCPLALSGPDEIAATGPQPGPGAQQHPDSGLNEGKLLSVHHLGEDIAFVWPKLRQICRNSLRKGNKSINTNLGMKETIHIELENHGVF